MNEPQQLQFEAPAEDPVSAYLASGLTSLNDDQITIVEEMIKIPACRNVSPKNRSTRRR